MITKSENLHCAYYERKGKNILIIYDSECKRVQNFVDLLKENE